MQETLLATLVVGLAAVVTVFAVVMAVRSSRAWQRALEEAAGTLGLEFRPGGWFRTGCAEGRVMGLGVKIDNYTVSTGKSSQTYTRIVVDADLPPDLDLGKEGLLRGIVRIFVGEDVQVGIEEFDEAYLLKAGREEVVLARMGARARIAVMRAVGDAGARVRKGNVEWTTPGLVKDSGKLERVATAMLELASALREHGSEAEALLHHAFADADPAFRRRALSVLLTRLSSSRQAGEALARAAEDPDPGLRYLALRHRGDDDLDAIEDLLREGLPEPMRQEAVALLGPRHAGGLSIADPGSGGELSLDRGEAGALSDASPRARPRQGERG